VPAQHRHNGEPVTIEVEVPLPDTEAVIELSVVGDRFVLPQRIMMLDGEGKIWCSTLFREYLLEDEGEEVLTAAP
jgi:hypothetical protein